MGWLNASRNWLNRRSSIHPRLVNAAVKLLSSRNAIDSKIRDAAVAGGMVTLRRAGLELALQGVTTISEVLRVTDVML